MNTTAISSNIQVITGNAAAAIAAKLARPDVVAAYPITPQTEVIEQISSFHASGEMDCELITVEGENSAMNAVMAASLAGGRVFTASSSWGLVFMYDAVLATAGARAPVVMVNVNRETPGIIAVSSGQQDMISTRDAGWIFLIAENCQEIMDLVLQSYRLAEDYDIQLPVMVHYDGFFLSYLSEGVEIPAQETVDQFLSVLESQPKRTMLRPGEKLGVGTHGILGGYMELRHKHVTAMERSKAKFDAIDQEFADIFSRSYGGQLEEYLTEDADMVLVGSGSMCGTIKSVIDEQREKGVRIGLVKIRMYRPFPHQALVKALKGKKAIGVVDRSLAFGFDGGPIYTELKAFETKLGGAKLVSFIDGIANTDITKTNVKQMIQMTADLADGKDVPEVTWVSYPKANKDKGEK
ncbi:pyruvate synthase subunit PorA [Desulfotignum phosphitoxidans]|jgi:pyruvate/2-oxoacid:ferredoxin oxidoreductase alpha subunit|uniref:Pyruvate synthase subunit PorA n=1 Tax=Desulfotignum phosphitoxidans DSM 13687 TaxID=1286635 RepID=S0G1M5_9BACT|nr:pyruvate synthase subunit PorA [Desulfotignum phosphitoxidans]EMS78077.1 pyruvate synthase subunit PorA [Desulfotignum phosphitoxidans DSM 13687]